MYALPTPVMNYMLTETIFIGYLSCSQLYVHNSYLVVMPITKGAVLFHCTHVFVSM